MLFKTKKKMNPILKEYWIRNVLLESTQELLNNEKENIYNDGIEWDLTIA